jgi:hypothetical protein
MRRSQEDFRQGGEARGQHQGVKQTCFCTVPTGGPRGMQRGSGTRGNTTQQARRKHGNLSKHNGHKNKGRATKAQRQGNKNTGTSTREPAASWIRVFKKRPPSGQGHLRDNRASPENFKKTSDHRPPGNFLHCTWGSALLCAGMLGRTRRETQQLTINIMS